MNEVLPLTSWYRWMQPYVVKNNQSPGKNYGFDDLLADGIPSLQEYLAEYCDLAVSTASFYRSRFHSIGNSLICFFVQMVDRLIVLFSIHRL